VRLPNPADDQKEDGKKEDDDEKENDNEKEDDEKEPVLRSRPFLLEPEPP